MPSTEKCPICGTEYKSLPQSLNRFACKKCGAILNASASPPPPRFTPKPAPPPPSIAPPAIHPAPAQSAPPPPYTPPSTYTPPPASFAPQYTPQYQSLHNRPSRARLLAGRSCIVLSILLYLGSILPLLGSIGMFVALYQPDIRVSPTFLKTMAAVFVGMTLLALASATTYLICGLKMRRGGKTSAIVALILASLSELAALLVTAAGLFGEVGKELASGSLAGFSTLAFYLLALAAFGQLIYFLIRVLQEPRRYS